MKSDEQQTNNIIKGGYFNVSTKPAEPIVNSLNNWGTASPSTPVNTNQNPSEFHQSQNNQQPASNT